MLRPAWRRAGSWSVGWPAPLEPLGGPLEAPPAVDKALAHCAFLACLTFFRRERFALGEWRHATEATLPSSQRASVVGFVSVFVTVSVSGFQNG